MLAKVSVVIFAMLMMSGVLGSAHAGEMEATSCVGLNGTFSCITAWRGIDDPNIRSVSTSDSAQEKAAIAERDQQWVARCHPVIKQDRYGVSRYHYAASGCEFGIIESN